jgi:hypothetical protein
MVRLTNEQGLLVLGVLKALDPDPKVVKLVEQLEEQLSTPQHDHDLIDTVVRLIGPGGRRQNIYASTERLDQLRTAILSPRELMKLSAEASKPNCTSCGRVLQDEHIMSMVGSNTYCVKCFVPTAIHCNRCDSPLSVYDSLTRLINRARKDCGTCASRAANAANSFSTLGGNI